MRAVADAAATFRPLGPASLQWFGQQATAFGKRLMGAGGNFTDDHAAGGPGDHVTAVGDIDLCFVVASFNPPTLVDRIELGMQRTAEHVKRQFGNFGTDRKHNRIP